MGMLVDYDSDKSRSDPGQTPNANGEHDVSLLLLLATALGTALCWPIEQPDYTCPASTITGMSSNIPVYSTPGAVHMHYPQACQAHSQDRASIIKEMPSTLPAQNFHVSCPHTQAPALVAAQARRQLSTMGSQMEGQLLGSFLGRFRPGAGPSCRPWKPSGSWGAWATPSAWWLIVFPMCSPCSPTRYMLEAL